MPGSPPPSGAPHKDSPAKALHVNAWNLLLLIPIFMVFTPVFNHDSPRLFGMPFFYWYQFAWVPVGVICVGLVYLKTTDDPVKRTRGARQTDELGESDQHDGDPA